MNPPPSTTESRFALEGFLPLPAVITVAVVLLALSWWLARRDSRFADRPRWVWGLLLLRWTAVIILAWMLAGPTLVTTVHSLRRKSLAILVDASASMGLVDAIDGSANVSRWAAAREDGGDGGQVRSFDEAAATLRAALSRLNRFARLPAATSHAEAQDLLAQSIRALKAGTAEARKLIAGNLPAGATDLRRSLASAIEMIDEKVLDPLQRKSGELRSGKALAALDRETWLPNPLAALSAAVGQVEMAADRFARIVEEEIAKSPGDAAIEEAKRSRFEKVQSFLAGAEATWLGEIRKKANVVSYEFGDKVIPRGTAPWQAPKGSPAAGLAASTRIAPALQQIALDSTGEPIEAAILITDGGQNAGRDPREAAPALQSTALHVVPIGNTRLQRDVIVHHTHAPKTVLQNDQVVVDSIVTAYDCDREKLEAQLVDNDAVVDRQAINVSGEVFDARVQLRWKAATLGKHAILFRVLPVARERSEENNVARADINVMEDKIRVLVADNFPRWETRYLLNLFKRDDRVAFEQLVFEPRAAAGEGARSAFPSTVEEWSRYRIVILGDLLPSQLPPAQQQLLRSYVIEAGGNLVLVAGRDAMPAAYLNQPLGTLIPVDPGDRPLPTSSPFYLHLADEGSMTLATQVAETPEGSERAWREMAEHLPLYGLSEISKPKPTAHSLIWASPSKTGFNPGDAWTRSFLSWHYVGAGRVVNIAAPVMYQLRYRQGDTFHHRFWGQLLRWAIARDLGEGSQTVRLATDKSRYEQGEPVQVSVRMSQLDGRVVSGAACNLSAIQEGKLIHETALKEDVARPGSYRGILEQLPVGPVKLEVTGERVKALLAQEGFRRPVETTITMDPSGLVELQHPLCNLPLLRELADASKGIMIPPTGLKAALAQLSFEPAVLENISKKPLWNRWDLFWLFIGCLTLEWAGRKYVGLS